MPDSSFDRSLEDLLEYSDSPEPEKFVIDVMQGVRRQHRTRKLILSVFSLIGAVFGLVGAMLLSDRITWLFTEALSATGVMQIVLGIIAALAFYTWFMNEDLGVVG